MSKKAMSPLTKARKKYLMEHTPIDRILDYWEERDMTEFIGTAGGDALTYRVYGNTTKTFKIYGR